MTTPGQSPGQAPSVALRALDGPPGPPAKGTTRCELRLAGRIYADVAPELREQLTRALEGGMTHLVVDASELLQIDSAGLNEFVQLLKKLRAKGGKIVFFGLNANIERVFQITMLHKVMGVAATKADAVGSLA
jgi:anti-sigma B factor antagonist